jgi:hypothetical protein
MKDYVIYINWYDLNAVINPIMFFPIVHHTNMWVYVCVCGKIIFTLTHMQAIIEAEKYFDVLILFKCIKHK